MPQSTLLALTGCLLALAAAARADDAEGARRVAERHFEQLFGFDAFEAWETRRGGARAELVVARRWREGLAEVVIDVRAPESLAKWAILLRQNRSRSDDLFAYVPPMRRVRRFTAIQLEREPLFDLVALDDFRPVAPGELDYVRRSGVELDGEPCAVIEGRPRRAVLSFDRLELTVSPATGFALRTRYFKDGRELRRMLISAGDLRDFGDRRLPSRRRIVLDPDGVTTELVLRNVLADPAFPDRFFTHHNLRVQRFPPSF